MLAASGSKGIDLDSHDHNAPTIWRDRFFRDVFLAVQQGIEGKQGITGCNFWAWGGAGRPRKPKAIWRSGDDLIGDPPHEYQGWYSVYDKDQTTLEIIRKFASEVKVLSYGW